MLTNTSEAFDIQGTFSELRLEAGRPVVVAVSGGSDSTALLLGLKAHFARQHIFNEIIAVTIDHGLRPDSATEAKDVAHLCDAQGIRHLIRKWEPETVSSGVQAAARDARYELLARAALDCNAQMVLTGHTLDDQLETVLMRKSRGAGRGMAGIAHATLYERNVWFVRPLLDCQRASLRTYLSDRSIGWVEDPSNDNPEFERVRIRQVVLSEAERQALLVEHVAALERRKSASVEGGALIMDPDKAGFEREGHAAWLSLSGSIDDGFEAALQVMLTKVGRRTHFAARPAIEQIFSFVRSGKNQQKFTAQGCLLAIDDDRLQIRPEARSDRAGQYGFDHLLPSMDLSLAAAVNYRLKRPEFPPLPLKNALC